jgi:hypothetical protein
MSRAFAPQTDRQAGLPFIGVAFAWLAFSSALCLRFPGRSISYALASVFLLWLVCLIDLYSLSRAVGAVLELAATSGEKRGPLTIQAFYWGMIKLLCLGILGIILFYGRSIPPVSLLAGTGTLVVVPLLGGYWWSQRALRHAS